MFRIQRFAGNFYRLLEGEPEGGTGAPKVDPFTMPEMTEEELVALNATKADPPKADPDPVAAEAARIAAEEAAKGGAEFTVPQGLNPFWADVAKTYGEGFELPAEVKPENEMAYLASFFNSDFVESLHPAVKDLVIASRSNENFDINEYLSNTTTVYDVDKLEGREAIYQSMILKGKYDAANPEHEAKIAETREWVDNLKDIEVLDREDAAKTHLQSINADKVKDYQEQRSAQMAAQIEQTNVQLAEHTTQAYDTMKSKTELFGIPITSEEHEMVKSIMDGMYKLDSNNSNLINQWWASLTPTQIYEFMFINLKGNKGFSDHVKQIKDSAGKAMFEKLNLTPTIFSSSSTTPNQTGKGAFGRPEQK